MSTKTIVWAGLLVAVAMGFVLLCCRPIPPGKTKATRINTARNIVQRL